MWHAASKSGYKLHSPPSSYASRENPLSKHSHRMGRRPNPAEWALRSSPRLRGHSAPRRSHPCRAIRYVFASHDLELVTISTVSKYKRYATR
eukprot:3491566-Pyramimonas_sp.AAC.2